ncbi:hypothetical protein G647_06297 [Cladophialophora carrionii CBS 160.54]|uniref:C2H2-type domain-containing protein n=1 Tax=Cladophialophora carrionii CBS 160.54 TaxID=1279043 RepID=V9D5P6_9EURO|nr:uncharacterized protein G647_06297 [Cladophialophora carrionii CBS 160.54]ETI22224.1 hypothetical protein G647_06297 [Cladophialophora carrionii CBS 160.54]
MEVQTQPREARIFSILNDNDCPSFVIRPRQVRQSSPTAESHRSTVSPPPRGERPSLVRHPKYDRESSVSSAGSPPALSRLSSSSKYSTSSMDSSPSPATPAYNFLDHTLAQYDPLLRQDPLAGGYLPSPTTITPFLEQQLLIGPNMPDQFSGKLMHPITANPYPIAPVPLHPTLQNLSTSSQPPNASVPPPATSVPANAQPRTSPTTSSAPTTGKKNKYPCPYAQSHHCQATFTTSGHAARHGKKHTGEKGVHCPICNKAFTRKDNMKQHERTHKGQSTSSSNSEDSTRKSKAAITKDAQKAKQLKKEHSANTEASRRSSLIHSPLSEVTSVAPTAIDTPLNVEESAMYADPTQVLMPIQTIPDNVSPSSLYPPLGDETLMNAAPLGQIPVLSKSHDPGSGAGGFMNPMPPLVRGLSDLDTLAQAAESFDASFYPAGLYPPPAQTP